MNISKLISFAAAAVFSAAVISGCSSKKVNKAEEFSVTEVSPEEYSTAPTEPIIPDSYPDYPVEFPEIEQTEAAGIYEAENLYFDDPVIVGMDKNGYSGWGYLTNFSPDGTSSAVFDIEAPSNQHYDLTFTIASETKVSCRIELDGKQIYRFETLDTGKFQRITLYGVFLEQGMSQVEIIPENGDIFLDCLEMCNSTSLDDIDYSARKDISNKNAGDAAKQLMAFLTENYGKYIITGQYAAAADNRELDMIYKNTGKYPVIRFAVLDNEKKAEDGNYKDIYACSEWARRGGIVGIMWQWRSPSQDDSSVYAAETGFSLEKARTDKDIALMPADEIRGLYAEGSISEECYRLVLDIDEMSSQLLKLKEQGIPVLWRPLHEASLGYDSPEGAVYWWGASGPENYKWLWELMYRRMTEYHGLDNLIWIWNGMSDTYMVDKNMFDIASYDLYTAPDEEFGSRCEQFAAAQKYIGNDKLIAVSESSCVPDIDAAFRDNAVWSFFGLWYGKYLEDGHGNISGEYSSKEEIIRTYNSDGAMTLDEYQKMTGYVSETDAAPEENTDNTEETPAEVQ